jgi:hypothetical protein
MKIAILFHDNDFHMTFKSVLNILLDSYQWHYDFPFTKEQFVELINEVSFGCCMINQNRFEYNNTPEQLQHTKEYLKLTSENILLNEEVDAYIKTLGEYGDNGETFILETDLDFENNKPIYSI